jgi:hypothetical protein
MFRHVSQSRQTLGSISEKHRETSNVSEFARKQFLLPWWANMETFEETSRITNVSATMFPSLPRALVGLKITLLLSLRIARNKFVRENMAI